MLSRNGWWVGYCSVTDRTPYRRKRLGLICGNSTLRTINLSLFKFRASPKRISVFDFLAAQIKYKLITNYLKSFGGNSKF